MNKDIKKALEHCIEWNCDNCPNREELGSGETVCRGRLLTDVLEYLSDLEAKLEELQNQKAIEELKLTLDNFRNRPTYFDVARQELCLSEQDKQFIDFINNRIKELGGEDV